MTHQIVPDFTFANFGLAAILAPIFITLMSLLKEPLRQKINAGLIAVAGGAYINGGLMPFDQLFNILLVFIAYKGLQNYKFIALGWILHTCWDIVHHFYANPIDPTMPDSTNVCAFFDPMIALWFFFQAPSVFDFARKKLSPQVSIVLFITIFTTFSAQSQVISTRDSVVKAYEQGAILLQGKQQYVINGTAYKMGFMQRKMGETLKTSPLAYAEFNLFKKNQKKALILNLVGGGAALAGILTQNTNQTLSVGLSVVGVGCLAVSLPFSSKSTKQFNKAIWMYNRDVLRN